MENTPSALNIVLIIVSWAWLIIGLVYGIKNQLWKKKGFISTWWDEIKEPKDKLITLWLALGMYPIVSTIYCIKNKPWGDEGFFSFWWFGIDKKEKKITAIFFWYLFLIIVFGAIAVFIFLLAIGGDGIPSGFGRRRNTDSLGRNYTDPYNQGRIDAANGASPLNPGDPNYMAGYNNNKKY